MAQTDHLCGLAPYSHINGSSWNGQSNIYWIPADDPYTYAVGDPVSSMNRADANGVQGVQRGTPGNSIRGVVVGIGFDPTDANLSTVTIPAVKTRDYYVSVVDDPSVMFVVQEEGSDVWLTETAYGQNANFFVSPNNGFVSGCYLDNTTVGISGNPNLKLFRLLPNADNTFGEFAQWIVLINNHELNPPSSGSGEPGPPGPPGPSGGGGGVVIIPGLVYNDPSAAVRAANQVTLQAYIDSVITANTATTYGAWTQLGLSPGGGTLFLSVPATADVTTHRSRSGLIPAIKLDVSYVGLDGGGCCIDVDLHGHTTLSDGWVIGQSAVLIMSSLNTTAGGEGGNAHQRYQARAASTVLKNLVLRGPCNCTTNVFTTGSVVWYDVNYLGNGIEYANQPSATDGGPAKSKTENVTVMRFGGIGCYITGPDCYIMEWERLQVVWCGWGVVFGKDPMSSLGAVSSDIANSGERMIFKTCIFGLITQGPCFTNSQVNGDVHIYDTSFSFGICRYDPSGALGPKAVTVYPTYLSLDGNLPYNDVVSTIGRVFIHNSHFEELQSVGAWLVAGGNAGTITARDCWMLTLGGTRAIPLFWAGASTSYVASPIIVIEGTTLQGFNSRAIALSTGRVIFRANNFLNVNSDFPYIANDGDIVNMVHGTFAHASAHSPPQPSDYSSGPYLMRSQVITGSTFTSTLFGIGLIDATASVGVLPSTTIAIDDVNLTPLGKPSLKFSLVAPPNTKNGAGGNVNAVPGVRSLVPLTEPDGVYTIALSYNLISGGVLVGGENAVCVLSWGVVDTFGNIQLLQRLDQIDLNVGAIGAWSQASSGMTLINGPTTYPRRPPNWATHLVIDINGFVNFTGYSTGLVYDAVTYAAQFNIGDVFVSRW